jgi:2,4-dienoyl-CoA reductase-like NADH-dependent reductase (Old Yellow Enzyme family)
VPGLFDELTIRGLTLRNRIAVSPMCQYSCTDGVANDWHFVHLASRAVGGAALVFTEAAAVTPEGRISPQDLGIWNDAQASALARIAAFIDSQGAAAGIQLAHAGRNGSTRRPWDGGGAVAESEGGWARVDAPSAIPFSGDYLVPHAMTEADIAACVGAFAAAAGRALAAGFRVIELHAAHGYLIHEFLSPLSNTRADRYGGSFENRTRLAREVALAVRGVWPASHPLFARISVTDWTDGGWDLPQSIELARALKECGVDLIDASSGGNVSTARIPLGPGYQTPFAEAIKREAGIATGAVGLITESVQAEHVIRTGQADLVLLARELLRDPYWPMRAARELGHSIAWPAQYLRAGPKGAPQRQGGETRGEWRG